MNKRYMYPITAAGIALTSVGCGDPIIADFTPTTVAGIALPFSNTYVDPATNYTTDYAIEGLDITVDKELTTIFTIQVQDITTDANGNIVDNQSTNYILNGVITTVEVGSQYTIKFTDAVDATNIFDLTCAFTDPNLNCTDQDGTAWNFTKK